MKKNSQKLGLKIFNLIKSIGLRISNHNKSRGFTLIETLVAISILMLSVTGPLYYASESLKAATYARDQITAFYLAQDAFEQIRKIRDDNQKSTSNLWNQGLIGCESGFVCRVAPSASEFYKLDKGSDFKLYVANNGAYTHSLSNATTTIFQRKIKIESIGTETPTEWNGSTEMKVTVQIIWNSRGVAREFEAYEFLRNFK